jgi:hypothetical protein
MQWKCAIEHQSGERQMQQRDDHNDPTPPHATRGSCGR